MNISTLRAMPGLPRSRRLAAVAVAFLIACALPMTQAVASSGAAMRVEHQIRACVNQERAKHGLRPLKDNRILDRAAHFHATNMALYNFYGHTDIWHHDPFQRIARFDTNRTLDFPQGENIAAGYRTAKAACDGWMSSPPHRANILDPGYTVMGAGFAHGLHSYRTYFVQDFGVVKPVSRPGGGSGGENGGTHHVVVRLFNVDDQETVYLNGIEVGSVGYGQTGNVDLGQLSSSDQVMVAVDNFSGGYSWGISEESDGRTVFDDGAGTAGSYGANNNDQTATGTVHRVIFDASGNASDSYTVQP